MKKAFIVLAGFGVFVFSFYLGRYTANPQVITLEGSNDLFKTVAHVDLSDYDYLTRVYIDGDKDIAYYMYTGDRSLLKAGDYVYAPYGEKFIVKSVDSIGFLIEPCDDTSYVQVGFSGMGILDADNNQLGAISYIQGNCIYCIWT